MIDGNRILAIIPARGGSKRLPRKNILDLAGKPLIAWTIESALGSKYIDKVVVSTDDNEICDISKGYGASVPFLRPDCLSTDSAKSVDTTLHTIHFLKNTGDEYKYVILLQPTSPLRSTNHIDLSIEQLIDKKAESMISVSKVEHPLEWIGILPNNLSMTDFISKENINQNSQELPDYYRINGAIYICNIEKIISERTFFLSHDSYAYCMNQEDSIDIDNLVDFLVAKVIIEQGIKD